MMKKRTVLWGFLILTNPMVAPMAAAGDGNWTTGNFIYDGSGNVADIGQDQYLYDRVSRLKRGTVKGPSHQQDYSYDSFGNRLASHTGTAVPCANGVMCDGVALIIDPATSHVVSGSAQYDDAGGLMHYVEAVRTSDGAILDPARAHDYSYDPAGMTSAQVDGSNKRQYIYTADDQRIAVYTKQEWRWSLRDLDQKVVRDFTSKDGSSFAKDSWTVVEDHVHSDRNVIGSASPSGHHHIHVDHLGSPRVITGDSGQFLAEHAFFPFGTELQLTTEDPMHRLKFTGHERDTIEREPMSLDYMHARYYASIQGRFLSVDPGKDWDPKQPQSWNMYAYVRNNPTDKTDPTGKATTCDPQNCMTTADTYDPAHSRGQTTVATPDMRTAATAAVDKVAIHIGTRETLGYGVRDANGNLTVKMAVTSLGNTTANSSGATASTTVPPGAEFAIHGHIDGGSNHSNGMVDAPALNSGYGDTQSLALNNPMPMATVSHGQVGWHEIQNGQLSFTAPVGALTPAQQQAMQHNLDSEQKLQEFWKP